MLPTLGEERRATYSPFLPISPSSGRVLYVPMKAVNATDGTITFDDEDGSEVTLPVTGGHVKLQWKPDFGMRYGISVEDWLKYAPAESLSLYNFAKPRAAKKLYFDVIPKNVDEYFQHLDGWKRQDEKARLSNPVWHIHNGNPPSFVPPVSFALLLNLVSAANASDKDILWGFIQRYAPEANPSDNPALDDLATYAVRYYQDFVKPNKDYRAPTDQERAALTDLVGRLKAVPEAEKADGEALQTLIFSVGKDHEFENLRNWFKAIYEVCLGQSQGPRFGSFVAIYGPDETAQLIEDALAGTLG